MSLLSRLAVQAARAYGMLARVGAPTNVSASYLVVAGGGGGGVDDGGGGGAGGYQSSTFTLSILNTYSITVGAGGTAPFSTTNGGNGSNSVVSGTGLTTLTSVGGGAGGSSLYGRNGFSGGSGGGGSGYAGGTGTGGAGTSGQGNNGGTSSTNQQGAGGGGAGAVGGAGGSGTGGVGLANSISGSSVYYAGGGGSCSLKAGGLGGGGTGAQNTGGGTAATAGTANTGGGGGAASAFGPAGAAGGSGIVIISYTSATPKFVGGTLTTSGGNQIHTFTSSGTLSPLTPITASYLVVAGGGGGGESYGGGGGGGGLLTSSTTLYSGATYVVTVGGGGAGSTSSSLRGSQGSNSVLSGTGLTTITSAGGGGGGSAPDAIAQNDGGTGGSGGGGASNAAGSNVSAGGAGNTPSTSPSQGNNGGSGITDGVSYRSGGGGGGAGAVGGNGTTLVGGNGGNGTASSISGSSVTYAGGGGGAAAVSTRGTGGTGGGGAGGQQTSTAPVAGTANLGGGGGGGADPTSFNGAAGGSGVVIISYAGSQAFNGGLVTSSGGNTIHTFTSTGALTPLTNNLTNSLRFRASNSAYLSRTPATAGSRTTWTWSGWVKRGQLGTTVAVISCGSYSTNLFQVYFDSSDQLYINNFPNSTTPNVALYTTQVFRDPSAWYHIVVVMDTTQATSSNRVKIYINGSQVTAFSTATYPAQNATPNWNTGSLQHNLGARDASTLLFDGYMADINFIDGQALEPYYFGNNDANGVWKPILYKGTYGTNGFYLPFTPSSTSSFAGAFNGSTQYLTTPTSTNFNIGTGDYTVEGWVYSTSNSRSIFCTLGPQNSSSSALISIQIEQTSQSWTAYCGDGSSYATISGGQVGTINNWVHIALVRNSGSMKLYVNGVGGTAQTLSSSPSNSKSWCIGGILVPSLLVPWIGNISNFRFIKGTALYTSNFTPPTAALTAVTNTQLLTLQNATIIDNSTNAFTITNNGSVAMSAATPYAFAALTQDTSGNNNGWNANNISLTAGVTYDSMTDVPTNTSATTGNYAVFNPLATASTVSNGNLNPSNNANAYSAPATIAFPSTGKFYAEFTVVSAVSPYPQLGIMDLSANFRTNAAMNTIGNGVVYSSNGQLHLNGSLVTTYATFTANDIISIAYDCSTGYVWIAKNGTWQNSGNPAAGTGYVTATTASTIGYTYAAGTYSSAVIAGNFGQRPLSYTIPSGFVALNTFNLPTPTILQGNKYMDATTYTGNSAPSNTIVNAGQFKPDFIWWKPRNQAWDHELQDSVRGTTKYLRSNSTNAEGTVTDGLLSFNSNGFTVGAGGDWNSSSANIVAWQWQAGQGSTSSNTSGSITSTVSVNTTAGFSVVTWTGNGTIGATVGHGLGVAPSFIIAKQRSGTEGFPTYHISLGATKTTNLNQTAATATSITRWNNTTPSNTVFTLYNDAATNGSGSTYVAYCWAEIAGFSKFGSYTGNGSTDGTFVYTGFRPRFILVKTTGISDWVLLDTARDTYNGMQNQLFPNSSSAESSGTIRLDALSNGFKLRVAGDPNSSGNTYIYAAFAENPFKNANAR
jgi:hypothetical protein